MNIDREGIKNLNTYKALLLYSLIAGCCLLNYLNYLETHNFNKELKKQIRICRQLLKKNNVNDLF